MKFYVVVLFFSCTVFSQQNGSSSWFKDFQDDLVTQQWDLKVNGFRLNDNLFLTASQDDYSGLVYTVKEIPVFFKFRVVDKVSVLAGSRFDIHTNRTSGSQQIGISTSFGLQYDYNKNTYFQAVFDYQLKQVENPYHYNYNLPASFNFKSGFKF